MKKIQLSQGLEAIIDDEDFDWLNQWKWSASAQGKRPETIKYRAVRIVSDNGKQCCILMHREILGAPDGVGVDHFNGNPLDNQRRNLRLATQTQNMLNATAHIDAGSPFKGVYWQKDISRWRARFRKTHLGTFIDEVEAAKAYDRAANAYDPNFARLNFPAGGALSARL